MLVFPKVPMDHCKMNFCKCTVIATDHSYSFGVHAFISFTRTCDIVGGYDYS